MVLYELVSSSYQISFQILKFVNIIDIEQHYQHIVLIKYFEWKPELLKEPFMDLRAPVHKLTARISLEQRQQTHHKVAHV